MKELLNDIGKRLPYQESDEYLSELIDAKTENAIRNQGKTQSRKRWSVKAASAAAVLALLIGFGLTMMHQQDKQPIVTLSSDGPLDEFLNSLSDEEAAQLPYYEIEEIPEY